MGLLPRVPAATLIAFGLLAAAPAVAEMFQYVDSQGRLHFTQDISQVPPEYRGQVERRELKKDISVTGSETAQGSDERKREMAKRKRELARNAQKRRPYTDPVGIPARAANPLTGAPEPRKYDKDCDGYSSAHRCDKRLTPEWQRWNQANGGANGKPVVRRKIGETGEED